MESLNRPHHSNNLVRESSVPSEDERDISPARKQHKAKQKRKASTISLRDNGKTKSRTSKGRQSLAQTTQEMTDALTFMKTYGFKPGNFDRLSAFDELQVEDDADSDETAPYLTKLTFEKSDKAYQGMLRHLQGAFTHSDFFLKLDEKDLTQRLQMNEPSNLLNSGYIGNSLSITFRNKPSWSKEAEQKNVLLEDRLAHDNELAVTGIMNLSSMNVTDNDLPMIIQRAFGGGRNKCSGLILRDNSLTSYGVKMIVDAVIAVRANLKYLSFSNNSDIGDAGVEHLVRLLQNNRTIIFLALPNTGMTDRGVRLLADVLCNGDDDADSSSSPPLEKLYVSFNKLVTDESMEAILQILEQNHTLKVLSVEHCSLSDRARKRLRQMGSKIKKKKFSLSE